MALEPLQPTTQIQNNATQVSDDFTFDSDIYRLGDQVLWILSTKLSIRGAYGKPPLLLLSNR